RQNATAAQELASGRHLGRGVAEVKDRRLRIPIGETGCSGDGSALTARRQADYQASGEAPTPRRASACPGRVETGFPTRTAPMRVKTYVQSVSLAYQHADLDVHLYPHRRRGDVMAGCVQRLERPQSDGSDDLEFSLPNH